MRECLRTYVWRTTGYFDASRFLLLLYLGPDSAAMKPCRGRFLLWLTAEEYARPEIVPKNTRSASSFRRTMSMSVGPTAFEGTCDAQWQDDVKDELCR